jgi:hypothetical protein
MRLAGVLACAALLDDLPTARQWLGVARSNDEKSDEVKQALEVVGTG